MGGLGSVVGDLAGGLFGGMGMENQYSPSGAKLVEPVTAETVQHEYERVTKALAEQHDFVNALQGQGTQGMGNQTALGNMLLNQSQGNGPNPAQAALNQATSQNVANQAALMAGQRGAGQNVGMIARQAGQQGSTAQQQAAAQSAIMQAQQQLAAQQQLGQLSANQIGQQHGAQNAYVGNTQGMYGGVLNAINSQNQNNIQQQMALNNINAGIASENQAAKNQFTSNLLSGAGSMMGSLFGGGSQPSSGTAMAGGPGDAMGSAGGGMDPSSMAMMFASKGGEIKMANGGQIDYDKQSSPRSSIGKFLNGMGVKASTTTDYAKPMMYASHGGKVPVMVSPGEVYVPPSKVNQAAQSNPIKEGTKIPGSAKVKGDSLKNDTVPAKLEQGGIVIPRSIVNSKDAGKKAQEFVEAILRKKGHLPKK